MSDIFQINLSEDAPIQRLQTEGVLTLEDLDEYILYSDDLDFLFPNEHGVLAFEEYECPFIVKRTENKDFFLKAISTQKHYFKISPKNLEQKVLSNLLTDNDVRMIIATGPAGTGKTLMTLACVLDLLLNKQNEAGNSYNNIVLTKPRTQVTDEEQMGEVPGDMFEKMAPQMLSYMAALDKLISKRDADFLKRNIDNGKIKVIPLEHMRGIDFSESLVICDEVQNLGFQQLKTLTTRINSTSKLICLGDTDQVDKRMKSMLTPIEKVINNRLFRSSDITAHVHLTQVERSRLTALMIDIFNTISP